jgi:hypothetical protein
VKRNLEILTDTIQTKVPQSSQTAAGGHQPPPNTKTKRKTEKNRNGFEKLIKSSLKMRKAVSKLQTISV